MRQPADHIKVATKICSITSSKETGKLASFILEFEKKEKSPFFVSLYRFGVIDLENRGSMLKDFYIIPLEAKERLHPCVPFEGPGKRKKI